MRRSELLAAFERLNALSPYAAKVVYDLMQGVIAGRELRENAEGEQTVGVAMPVMVRRAHRRAVPLKVYTIVCERCGQEKTFSRYPGKPPRFCPACKHKPKPARH
jgi:predicted Zn-ribbon and HTH transcriptional regulator